MKRIRFRTGIRCSVRTILRVVVALVVVGWVAFGSPTSLFAQVVDPDPCPFMMPPVVTWQGGVIPQGEPFKVAADQDGLTCGVPHVPAAPLMKSWCVFDWTPTPPPAEPMDPPAGPIAVILIHPGAVPSYTMTCDAPTTLSVGMHTAMVVVENVDGRNASDILSFQIGAPPVVNCVVGNWHEWQPWIAISPILEQRIRVRDLTPPMNGGTPCPGGVETETRSIIVVPPACTCPYITPAGVTQTLTCGDIKSGPNVYPTNARNDQLLDMGMKLTIEKIGPVTVQVSAVCVGKK